MMPPAVSVCPYISHDVDAQHVPKRRRFRRQRRTAADQELELIEADLVEDRAEHELPPNA